jgi:hypothetical protein
MKYKLNEFENVQDKINLIKFKNINFMKNSSSIILIIL